MDLNHSRGRALHNMTPNNHNTGSSCCTINTRHGQLRAVKVQRLSVLVANRPKSRNAREAWKVVASDLRHAVWAHYRKPVLSNFQVSPGTVRALGCVIHAGARRRGLFDEAHRPLQEAPVPVPLDGGDSRRPITRVRYWHVLADIDAAACLASVSRQTLDRSGASCLKPSTREEEAGGRGGGGDVSFPIIIRVYGVPPVSFGGLLNTKVSLPLRCGIYRLLPAGAMW